MATITGPSLGYAGSVTEVTGKDYWTHIGSSRYGVVGEGDLKVSVTTGDRMLLVAGGRAWGHNILDTLDVSVSVQLDSVASGSRWDMVVVRRDVTARTTVEVVKGTSAKTLPSLTTTSASHADQPLALCRVDAGSTTVQAIVDLRCWSVNGGLVAADSLATSYLANPGAEVRVGKATFSYEPQGNGQFGWVKRAAQQGTYSVATTSSAPNKPNYITLESGLFTATPNIQLTWQSQSGQPPRMRAYDVGAAGFGVNVMSDVGDVSGIVHWRATQE